jgi:hypothetical protein
MKNLVAEPGGGRAAGAARPRLMGFPPDGVRETGYRVPTSVDPVSGAVHKRETLRHLLEKTDRLLTADKAMKALQVRVARTAEARTAKK